MEYKELVKEIQEIQDILNKYSQGVDVPPDFNYKKVLARLSYLRNRKRQIHKKSDGSHRQDQYFDVD